LNVSRFLDSTLKLHGSRRAQARLEFIGVQGTTAPVSFVSAKLTAMQSLIMMQAHSAATPTQ
jgi:hypothetical protein